MSGTQNATNHIPADQVNINNSNLWRHDPTLSAELRKLRFRKARPDVYNLYCQACGIDGAVDPTEAMDFRIDIENFVAKLTDPTDELVFRSFLIGQIRQREIAEMLGCCQATVSNRLRRLLKEFATYYKE